MSARDFFDTDPMEFACFEKDYGCCSEHVKFINKIHPIDPNDVIGDGDSIKTAPMNILDPKSYIEIRCYEGFSGVFTIGKIPVDCLDAILLRVLNIEYLVTESSLSNCNFGNLCKNIQTNYTTYFPREWEDWGYKNDKVSRDVSVLEFVRESSLDKIIELWKHLLHLSEEDETIRNDQKTIQNVLNALEFATVIKYKYKFDIINIYQVNPDGFWDYCVDIFREERELSESGKDMPEEDLHKGFYFRCLCTLIKSKKITIGDILDDDAINIYKKEYYSVFEKTCFLSQSQKDLLGVWSENASRITIGFSPEHNMYAVNQYMLDEQMLERWHNCIFLKPSQLINALKKACKIRDCIMEISFLEAYKHACSL